MTALEDRIFTMIALYQPVARDLRTLVCSLMIVQASERIGRYGKDIANATRHLADSRYYREFYQYSPYVGAGSCDDR